MLRNLIKATLPCAALLIASAPLVSAVEYLNEDFEGYTINTTTGLPGDPMTYPSYDPNLNQPSSFSPATVFNDLYFVVDNSSIAPNTNQIGRIFDDSTGGNLDYRSSVLDFQGESGFYSSFTFNFDNDRGQSNLTRVGFFPDGNGTGNPLLGVQFFGNWDDLNEDTIVDPNELQVSLSPYTDNFWGGTGFSDKFSGLTRYEDHTVEIFANQNDTNILTYTGPDSNSYDLYQNYYDVWVDGVRGGGRDPSSSSPEDHNYRMKGENKDNDNTEVGDSTNLAMGITTVNVNHNLNLDYFSMELDDIIVSSIPSLAAGLAGDYNGDGTVDASDYALWRDNLGGADSAFAAGSRDPSGAGPIDSADFDFWKANYGAAAPGGAQATPEPATLSIALLGTSACLAMRRRRR